MERANLTSSIYEITIRRAHKEMKGIKKMSGTGIEPMSAAWKAAMLTITPTTLLCKIRCEENINV